MTAVPDILLTGPPSPGPRPPRTPPRGGDPAPAPAVRRSLGGVFGVGPRPGVPAPPPGAGGGGRGGHAFLTGGVFSVVPGMGISGGSPRHFTHNSFKAAKPLRV